MADEIVDIPLRQGFFGEHRLAFKRRSWHRHAPGQILLTLQGSVRVQTQGQAGAHFWYLPALQGLWIPPSVLHAAEAENAAQVVSIYIEKRLADTVAKEPVGFQVSSLLRELILECARHDFTNKQFSPQQERLFLCLFDQLQASRQNTIHFPLPDEPRLKKLVEILLADPGNKDSIVALSKKVGASAKTLSRLLAHELDISFTDLRNTLRIFHACRDLEIQDSIVDVAFQLGFSSQSAFTTLFRKYMGTTPKQYAKIHRQEK